MCNPTIQNRSGLKVRSLGLYRHRWHSQYCLTHPTGLSTDLSWGPLGGVFARCVPGALLLY